MVLIGGIPKVVLYRLGKILIKYNIYIVLYYIYVILYSKFIYVQEVQIMKYIKSNTVTGEAEEVIINASIDDVIDISQDSDDVRYTFDTYEDYKYFVDHINV